MLRISSQEYNVNTGLRETLIHGTVKKTIPKRAINMSELQNDEAIIEDNDPVENQEIETDLAPVSEAEHEEQPQVDEEAKKQEAIQKAINKKHFEAEQAKRDLQAANQKIADFESKQREQMAAQVGNIPPMPDAFDDDYEEKVRARELKIREKAQFDFQQQSYLQQQQLNQQTQAQAEQERRNELGKRFTDNAKKAGSDDGELNSIINTLNQAGISNELGDAIMGDDEGFFTAKYLAANPTEAYELTNMNPILAGAKLVEIRSKASVLKPKQSAAPKPATNLSGNGIDPEDGKYKNIKGATFN